MSWDGIIFRAPADVSVNDLPDSFQMRPLGTTAEIGERLRTLLPNARHHDGQCCVEGDDFWLELNFGYPKDTDISEHIGVRTNAGLGVIPILRKVCVAFDARLFDNQISEFADFGTDTELSMSKFSEWRDRAIGKAPSESDQN